MFKILKYNLKESLKYMTIILSLGIILFSLVFILFKADRIIEEAAIGFYILITFGVFLTTLIYIINAYKNELYQERAYLTFTLPLKGWEVLGAKVMLSVILFIISGLICLLSFLIFTGSIGEVRIIKLIKIGIPGLRLPDKVFFMFTLFSLLIQWLQFILTIFLSINLSKVAIKNKEMGFISFVIFMVVNFLIGFIGAKVVQLVPYRLDLYTGTIVKSAFSSEGILVNIGFFIYNIIIVGLIFSLTSYLLEKKVEL